MSDQGEKIVFLAREILNAGAPEISGKKKIVNVSMTFKTLCFTAALAATGGALAANFAHEYDRPLNRYEKVEIQALVFYTAKVKNIDETILRQEIEQKTGIVHLDDMTASDFSTVRRYLQEKAQ